MKIALTPAASESSSQQHKSEIKKQLLSSSSVFNHPVSSTKRMKRNLFLLFALLLVSVQSFGQVAGSSFEMYVMRWRFGPKALDYFQTKNIEVTNYLAPQFIQQNRNHSRVDAAKVKRTLEDIFRNPNSDGKLVLNWEDNTVFKGLRDNRVTDSRYKYAEAEWRKLISIIRATRPNVKIGIYGIPFKAWTEKGVDQYNPQGKYDGLLSLVDFLAPSVYIQFADEEVGHERNLKYIGDIMDSALDYGKRLRKPVYPFLWGRVHNTNPKYGNELIQINVFAKYVKFISTHSYNGYKATGFYWWESADKSANLSEVDGINNWARGLVTDYASYDALMVKYATAVVKTLAGTTTAPAPDPTPDPTPEPEPEPITEGESFTLVNADTEKDIQTLASGATINLSTLPTRNLNIRYNSSTKVGSVVFRLSGETSKSTTESGAPYALFGDNNSDYNGWTPSVGSYTLKATPYSENGGDGTASSSTTINFTVVNDSEEKNQPTTNGESFTLINADTEEDIMTLASGATINLAALPTKNLNIRYNSSTEVGSVVLSLSGEQSMKVTESGAPYAFEDNNGNYKGWSFATGSYTLKATPYTENGGDGTAGSTLTINFTVVDNANSSIAVTSTASNSTAGSATGENNLSADGLTVYPIPATTVLYMELGEEAGGGVATIELQDFNGQTVLTKKMDTATDGRKAELDVSGIKEGMYVLAVTSSAGRTTKRVVIE